MLFRSVSQSRYKQQAFTHTLLRYPSWDSNIPKSIMLGTIVGMLVRTLRLTTRISDFKQEALFIIDTFRRRKYPEQFIRRGIKKFVFKYIEPELTNEWIKNLQSLPDSGSKPAALPPPKGYSQPIQTTATQPTRLS